MGSAERPCVIHGSAWCTCDLERSPSPAVVARTTAQILGKPSDAAICEHREFDALVNVNRIEDTGRFVADIQVACRDCKRRFRFVGLPSGVSTVVAMMSPVGLEARLPIEPVPSESPHAHEPLGVL